MDFPSTCHPGHVSCKVRWLEHHRSSKQIRTDLPTCGHSDIEESNTCWNNLKADGTACEPCTHGSIAKGAPDLGLSRLALANNPSMVVHSNNDFCNEEAC